MFSLTILTIFFIGAIVGYFTTRNILRRFEKAVNESIDIRKLKDSLERDSVDEIMRKGTIGWGD